MTRETRTTVDVLVVGAGPSGLTTALAASRGGAGVLLIDRHAGTSVFPKATGIRPRSMEILRSWGLADRVRARAQPLRLAGAVSQTLAGPVLQEIWLGAPDPDDLRRVSPSEFAVCPQDELEPVLVQALAEQGGRVRFRTELIDIGVDRDGVTARLRSRATGIVSQVRARYLVGADGAESTVRQLAGIGLRMLGSEGEQLAILFRADLAARIPDPTYALRMVAAPGVDGVFVPSGRDHRWAYDRQWHPERGEHLADWTEQRCVEAIRAAAGMPDLEPEILRTFAWTFGAAVADRMQEGRVFLVGDAAHRTTPRGATGMNTGIADGHNLGWKLAWVVRGWAGAGLPETYADERYPVGLQNATDSLRPAASRPGTGLEHDFHVVYRSSGIRASDKDDTAAAAEVAVPGGRAPHVWILWQGRRISSLDLFDGRLTVITGGDRPEWHAATAGAADCGLPIAVITVGDDVIDASGMLTDRYGLTDSNALLVRPDGHVASRLADPSGLDTALRSALGWASRPLSLQH